MNAFMEPKLDGTTGMFDVIVAGAGPAGMTLALDLGRRGVRVLLVERNEQPGPWPKMERTNARSMEIYRRLGLADAIRAVGYTPETSMDVFTAIDLATPIARLQYPTVAEQRAWIAETCDGSAPLEPYQLVSQYALEPALKAAVDAEPNVCVRFGHELTRFEQGADGVTVHARRGDGTGCVFGARYLAGCDGGASRVRKALGIRLEGRGDIKRMSQVQFRSGTLYDRIQIGKGRHYYLADGAIVVVQGNRTDFTLHTDLSADTDFEPVIRRYIPVDFDCEVLRVNEWTLHLLVAEHYRKGRVFLAGDAVHRVIPTGGLGMNTAVGDAIDLGWKLAAAVHGWGGPRMLDSYEIERRAVGLFNRQASGWASEGPVQWRAAVTPNMLGHDTAGARARSSRRSRRRSSAACTTCWARRWVTTTQVRRSSRPSPERRPNGNSRATCPPRNRARGCRTSGWLAGAPSSTSWAADTPCCVSRARRTRPACRARSKPWVRRCRSSSSRIPALPPSTKRLLLLRPDLHVAWRGSRLPLDLAALARQVTGHDLLPQLDPRNEASEEHAVAS